MPLPGTEEDYDRCISKIEELEKQLNDYLKEQRRSFSCPDIEFRHQVYLCILLVDSSSGKNGPSLSNRNSLGRS